MKVIDSPGWFPPSYRSTLPLDPPIPVITTRPRSSITSTTRFVASPFFFFLFFFFLAHPFSFFFFLSSLFFCREFPSSSPFLPSTPISTPRKVTIVRPPFFLFSFFLFSFFLSFLFFLLLPLLNSTLFSPQPHSHWSFLTGPLRFARRSFSTREKALCRSAGPPW